MTPIEVQIRHMMNVFIVLFVVVTAVLVFWQVGQAQSLSNSPYKICIANEQPVRGTIYDRNGVKLAYSVKNPNYPCGWQRIYTDPTLSPVLGYFSYQYGATGIEEYYNDVLTGQNPSPNDAAAQETQFINGLVHEPVYGSDIYLSIDEKIQQEVEKAFNDDAGCGVPSPIGAIIVQDPQTGQILAMVSNPYFDPNKISDPTPAPDNPNLTVGQEYWQQINSDPTLPLLNRALQGRYAPGSTFKVVTLIAGLDSGQFTLDSSFTSDEVHNFSVNGFVVHNDPGDPDNFGPTYPMDLTHAFAYSVNVVFARVGVQIGAQVEQDYASRFYLSTPDNIQQMPIDISNVPPSYLYVRTPLTDGPNLAATAYGQGEQFLNPMTLALVGDAVANNGVLVDPHFLLKIVPHGESATSVPVAGPAGSHQVFSAQTAQQVQTAMRADVDYGTIGSTGNGPGIRDIMNLPENIRAKTGTAQTQQAHSLTSIISIGSNPFNAGPSTLTITALKEQGLSGACLAPMLGDVYPFAFQTLSGQG
jgi:peptidoglycan glycosyltransferase